MTRKIALQLFVCLSTLFAASAMDAAAQSISVTPGNPSIFIGHAQQFTVPEVIHPVDVVAGDYHACVLLQNGTIRCAGNNSAGQLGNGAVVDSSTPVAVSGIGDAVAVTTGGYHSCALLRDGTVQCWGMNEVGELGDGTTNLSTTPVTVSGITTATAVAAGYKHVCALLQDGTVQCWGDDSYGELGDGNTVLQTQRGGQSTAHSSIRVTVVGINTAVAITSSDGYHSCAVLQDGTVKCWGDNSAGQIGDGTRATAAMPVAVAGITTAAAVTSGDFHTCALLRDSTVDCWGLNFSGQLGDGTGFDSYTPVQVSGISTAVAVSAGVIHTCAVLQNGAAECWGHNSSGQIGDGTTTNRLAPVAVGGVSTAIGPVAAGNNDSCVLLQNGFVKCWGMNTYGELGNGTTADAQTPALVAAIIPTWATSDGSIATVDATGLASGVGAGSATITATYGGGSGSATLVVAEPPRLTVARSGSGIVTSSAGGIECGTTCSTVYDDTTVVTLSAAPLDGFMFLAWNGCDTVSGTTCTVTVSAPRVISATFIRPVITVTKAGTGRGSVTPDTPGLDCGAFDDTCTAAYDTGTALRLTATPVSGSRFNNWSGCDSVTAAGCSVTMNASRTVIPTFTRIFTLSVIKAGVGSGTVTSSPDGINCGSTCSTSFDSGTVVTLTATPGMASIFNGWDGCDTASGSSCTVSMSAAKSVTVNFLGVPLP
jgi:alpha-tubulin suppressor-like RCC1 family protein